MLIFRAGALIVSFGSLFGLSHEPGNEPGTRRAWRGIGSVDRVQPDKAVATTAETLIWLCKSVTAKLASPLRYTSKSYARTSA
jgi:hypothetical protein